jgi:hypothetical protein
LLKTFIFGILLGILAVAAALYLIPVVDQHREVSLVSVAPNGGNVESFHINMPMDRVMVGAADETAGHPAGLDWPGDDILANVSAEIFKVRNERDTVIGVAARTVAQEEGAETIDWLIHLPARGSLFINMEPEPREGGHRIGQLRAGTGALKFMSGFATERWQPDTSGEEDAPAGRIELVATYVGSAESLE